MKKIFIVLLVTVFIFQISGCANNDLDIFNEEKEQLTNEILELNKQISKKDEEINRLEKINSEYRAKLNELTESLDMVRFSSYARLDDYNNSFYNLEKTYRINSKYVIEDDWYVIEEDYFQIELLEYENVVNVDFYTLRMESDQGPLLAFTDTDPEDGWIYTNDNISEIINKHRSLSGGFSNEPYFLIYTEVKLKDGDVIRTSKLPIYYK